MSFSEDKTLEKCKGLALRYISLQAKTEGQVEDYLKRNNFDSEYITHTIDFLREYNYVNDKEYCITYYKEASMKGKARKRIEQELMRRKVKNNVIKDAFDEFESEDNEEYRVFLDEAGSDKERALVIGRKMLKQQIEVGKEADKNFMAKVGRRLMSLGYESQILYSVIGTLMKEAKLPEDEEY